MKVECNVVNKCLVVSIDGELDHHNAKMVREKIDKLIERNKTKNLIFNFSDMDFMDSSGIGVIMGRYKNVSSMGGTVAVSNVKSSVDRIFTLSGLYKIVKKYDDVNQAIEGL